MAKLNDDARDNGLQQITDRVDEIHICSQEPTTFTEASSTYTLGNKTSPTISAPQDGDTNGRKVEASAFSDGSVTATGTATHWAWVDTVNSILYATEALSSSQSVTSGNTFSLDAHAATIPDAA